MFPVRCQFLTVELRACINPSIPVLYEIKKEKERIWTGYTFYYSKKKYRNNNTYN